MKPASAPRNRTRDAHQPRPPWRWALVGATVGALVLLTLAAPARWLARVIGHTTVGHVQLIETQGTIWNGSGILLLAAGAGSRDQTALPGRLNWQLRPTLKGLRIRLQTDCCTPDGPIVVRVHPAWDGFGLQVDNSQSFWPATLLAGLGTPFNTIALTGELALSTHGLSIQWSKRVMQWHGALKLTARDVSSRLSPLKPLGSYEATLRSGQPITIDLKTLHGKLLVEGKGQFDNTRWRFNGSARAAPGFEAQLANFLNILGQRRGDAAIISLG